MTVPEGKNQISVTEALDKGWTITLAHFVSILLLSIAFLLILLLIASPLGIYSVLTATSLFDSGWAQFLLRETMGTATLIAIANCSLKLADGQNIHFGDLFSKLRFFFHVLIADALYILVVAIGLICFIIPGILFALRFGLYDLYIVDQGCGPIEALQKSWKTVKGYTWKWLGFAILTLLILFLGLLCFLVGLLFAWPTTVIARALLFRQLSRLTFPVAM